MVLTCFFCQQTITPEKLHYHHLVPVADGGDPRGETVACHRDCHNAWHRDQGHYERWARSQHAERVRMFGTDKVHRLLAHWGRRGWDRLVKSRGDAYLAKFHRDGGRARAANGRNERGQFIPTRFKE